MVASAVRRPLSVSRQHFQSTSPLKFLSQFQLNLFGASRKGGKKVYIYGPGHMTKVAAMPIYGENFKKYSSPEPLDQLP